MLPGVRSINLSHNRIAIVSNLEYCYSLERLDLSHNLISSLDDVFVVLGNVHQLNLSANYITSTSGLERLYGLEVGGLFHYRLLDLIHWFSYYCLSVLWVYFLLAYFFLLKNQHILLYFFPFFLFYVSTLLGVGYFKKSNWACAGNRKACSASFTIILDYWGESCLSCSKL